MAISNRKLERLAKFLLDAGVWDPEELYQRVLRAYPRVHYSRVREAIHKTKAGHGQT